MVAADRPTRRQLSQQEWDRRQREGSWRQLPPYQPPRRDKPNRGHDYVAAALALGPARVRRRIEPVNHADIPPEKLAAPTLGAIQRQAGITGWCQEARVMFALEFALEAQRRILLERLDSIMQFVAVGATPDQAMARIRKLVDEYGRPELEAAA